MEQRTMGFAARGRSIKLHYRDAGLEAGADESQRRLTSSQLFGDKPPPTFQHSLE